MSAPDPADSREIAPGVGVMIRTADGTWIGPTRALSSPHLNVKHKFGRRPWLVVSVQPGTWEHPINWPAEDVRLATGEDDHG